MTSQLKAIETIYKGYRFRSRLEARWAVFFDALGIEWSYEKEGYDLDGVWYLPDFWLPKQEIWVEVKAGKPSELEQDKAERLVMTSEHDVVMVFDIPRLKEDEDPGGEKRLTGPWPDLWRWSFVPASNEYASMTSMGDACRQFQVSRTTLKKHIERLGIKTQRHRYDLRFEMIAHKDMQRIANHLNMMPSRTGSASVGIPPGILIDDGAMMWACCPVCGYLDVTLWGSTDTLKCRCLPFIGQWSECDIAAKNGQPRFNSDAPRILIAYDAARQARFEHGEKGGPR